MYYHKVFMTIFKLLYFLSITLFIGCASTSYKEVFIPVKCNIEYPQLPNQTHDLITNQKQIVIYVKELENALDCCIKGVCE